VKRVLRWLAGAALLGLLLQGAGLWRRAGFLGQGTIATVRVAHWQLEPGVAEAFDAVARRFEELHPGVVVAQTRVPERAYVNWTTTQLIGGTAPDLVQIPTTFDSSRLARFFVPMSAFIERPNPYNAGTELEGIPWRRTYVDGMEGGYRPELNDHYGVPLFLGTVRLFYNRTRLRQLTGRDAPPEQLDAFLELCREVREASDRAGQRLAPVAGSRYTALILFNAVMQTLTQTTMRKHTSLPGLAHRPHDFFAEALHAAWNLEDPAVRTAIDAVRRLSAEMPPGFMQGERQDAMFQFLQERALFIPTGNWDAAGLRAQAPFEVGVAPLPAPLPGDARYSAFVLGPMADAGQTAAALGLTREAEHPEWALAFLQFLTSREGNEIFCRVSGWLPVLTGVPVQGPARDFVHRDDGYVGGVTFDWGWEVRRQFLVNLHHLTGPGGGTEVFIEHYGRVLPEAIRHDLQRLERQSWRIVAARDSRLVKAWLNADGSADGRPAPALWTTLAEQNVTELEAAFLADAIGRRPHEVVD
jgi:raffinose/stachyose/melibiose transport system substrate-binding protein